MVGGARRSRLCFSSFLPSPQRVTAPGWLGATRGPPRPLLAPRRRLRCTGYKSGGYCKDGLWSQTCPCPGPTIPSLATCRPHGSLAGRDQAPLGPRHQRESEPGLLEEPEPRAPPSWDLTHFHSAMRASGGCSGAPTGPDTGELGGPQIGPPPIPASAEHSGSVAPDQPHAALPTGLHSFTGSLLLRFAPQTATPAPSQVPEKSWRQSPTLMVPPHKGKGWSLQLAERACVCLGAPDGVLTDRSPNGPTQLSPGL